MGITATELREHAASMFCSTSHYPDLTHALRLLLLDAADAREWRAAHDKSDEKFCTWDQHSFYCDQCGVVADNGFCPNRAGGKIKARDWSGDSGTR